MTLAEMAERASAMNGPSGVACPKCNCRDFRTYKTIPGINSIFRYKSCRVCGHKILTTSQTSERVVREIESDNTNHPDETVNNPESTQLTLGLNVDENDQFENDVF